jgi:protein gp37
MLRCAGARRSMLRLVYTGRAPIKCCTTNDMAKDSRIEWTHHTFNPWWGCAKVSPACAHCYAESWARRLGSNLWGREASRRFFDRDHWQQPIRWNKEAKKSGERRRVFCASMADVFEPRAELHEWREALWPLIEETGWLDWLLLTKRPQNVARMVPWKTSWPANIWLGTTAENQKYADIRVPLLAAIPAKIRFVSAEPLLSPISFQAWKGVDWVIAGGESGHGARPTDPNWVRSLRDECRRSGIAFHFKQWGHWAPTLPRGVSARHRIELGDQGSESSILYAIGKKAAGRLLDGETWDQLPG